MLTIEQYGVKLTRLQEEEIEMVRLWRNANHVKSNMLYQGNISTTQQKKWFQSINNASNYYFIINFEGKQVGLINAKNFDPSQGFGEGGIFIGDPEYIDSIASTLSSLCLLNFVFFKLKLTDISRIRVLKSNRATLNYNEQLGYKFFSTNDDESDVFELNKSDYLTKAKKILELAKAHNQGNDEIVVTGNPSEINLPEINDLLINQNAQ